MLFLEVNIQEILTMSLHLLMCDIHTWKGLTHISEDLVDYADCVIQIDEERQTLNIDVRLYRLLSGKYTASSLNFSGAVDGEKTLGEVFSE